MFYMQLTHLFWVHHSWVTIAVELGQQSKTEYFSHRQNTRVICPKASTGHGQ